MHGPSALATAGSGDVLAGILAGTVSTMGVDESNWELLCSYAVTVHSYAGYAAAAQYGERSVIATDLIDLIGDAMQLASDEAFKELGIGNGSEE